MSFQAIRLVGVARTSVAMQTVLVWSTALAVIFLGERLSAAVAAGSVLILCGGVLLVFERGEVREKIPLVYYLAPLLTALSFAITFILRRYGLAWIPSSPLGMGTANLTAGVVLAAALPFTGEKFPRPGAGGGYLFALLGGILNAAAALFFWTAVQMGEVVQVVPINRLSVLFVILFSWLFFRKQELITLRLLLGAALSVLGAFVIAAVG
jgi:transporter family protein